jgi:phosphatidylinositol alpha-1,6-mannosyltransferase
LSAAAPARTADVILCGHVAVAPVAWLLSRVFGRPYIVYVHALEITAVKYRPLIRFFMARARGIFTGSKYGRRLVEDYLGISAAAVEVLKPAVAPDILAAARRNGGGGPAPREPGGKVILTVGRLRNDERYKGHDVVIEALNFIRKRSPKISYWVVGDGDDLPRLKRLAEDAGVAGLVTFWGRATDVAAFYRACDVFVMPSRQVLSDGREKAEGFGLVYLEAAAFGKPVVAGACGGALDAVVDGLTGVLIDPEDPVALASAVVGLLADPACGARFGAAGKRRVLEEFTPGAYAIRVDEAVTRALAAGRSGIRG